MSGINHSSIGISPRRNLKADQEFLIILNNVIISDVDVEASYRCSRRSWNYHYLCEFLIVSI